MSDKMIEMHGPFWPHSWHWRDCQEEMAASWRRNPPVAPRTGQGWYDERSNCLYIWDGIEWVCVPAD